MFKIILSVLIFLISVAGLFFTGLQIAKLLEKIFHIHLTQNE